MKLIAGFGFGEQKWNRNAQVFRNFSKERERKVFVATLDGRQMLPADAQPLGKLRLRDPISNSSEFDEATGLQISASKMQESSE